MRRVRQIIFVEWVGVTDAFLYLIQSWACYVYITLILEVNTFMFLDFFQSRNANCFMVTSHWCLVLGVTIWMGTSYRFGRTTVLHQVSKIFKLKPTENYSNLYVLVEIQWLLVFRSIFYSWIVQTSNLKCRSLL